MSQEFRTSISWELLELEDIGKNGIIGHALNYMNDLVMSIGPKGTLESSLPVALRRKEKILMF